MTLKLNSIAGWCRWSGRRRTALGNTGEQELAATLLAKSRSSIRPCELFMRFSYTNQLSIKPSMNIEMAIKRALSSYCWDVKQACGEDGVDNLMAGWLKSPITINESAGFMTREISLIYSWSIRWWQINQSYGVVECIPPWNKRVPLLRAMRAQIHSGGRAREDISTES